MADPENIKAIIRLRPPLQIVQPLNSSASSAHYIPRQTRLYHPSSSSEDSSPPSCPYTLQPENSSIYAGGSWFTFDGVHSSSTSTNEIYQTHISSMIQDAVRGYNSTLFAYGATGSGKSYSMMGTEKDEGIMQRAIEEVFDLIEQDQEREYVVRASYLEIYNEQLRDLLVSDRTTANQNLPKIHEDRQGRIFVRPLVSTPCGDPEDVMKLLASGESRRRTERTEWNLHSSRSHAIFSLTLESRPVFGPSGFPITSSTMRQVTRQNSRSQLRTEIPSLELAHPSPPPPHAAPGESPSPSSEVFLGTGISKMPMTPSVTRFKTSTASSKSSVHVHDGSIRISQLNLVDLAGSEKLTDNEARNKEASYIKKSLLALQSVVSSLTELGTSVSSTAGQTQQHSQQKQRLMHIPYRNSQLTRLLQTSLSGNAKVAFLFTISPDLECEVETLSTLRFAAGAKKVETKAELGQVVDRATLLEALEAKVLELEAALMTNADYTEALERERDEAIERADGAEKICDDYESKLAELQTLRTPLKEQHDHLKRLILTGSPRSSYATQTTLEHHTTLMMGPSSGTSTLNRKKSTNSKKPSRLSEATTTVTAAASSSPTKKVCWKELFFDEPSAVKNLESNNTTLNHHANPLLPDIDGIDKLEKINELNLNIAKLEATLAEAEDTHNGEISELRAEVNLLENRIKELQKNASNGRDQPAAGLVNESDTIRELQKQLEETRRISDEKGDGMKAELNLQQQKIEELEAKLVESEATKENLRTECERLKVEHRKQVDLQSQLITTLEHKLHSRLSAKSKALVVDDHSDSNALRRYSEATVDGDIDNEDEMGMGIDHHIHSGPRSPSKLSNTKKLSSSSRSRSRSKSHSNKHLHSKLRNNSIDLQKQNHNNSQQQQQDQEKEEEKGGGGGMNDDEHDNENDDELKENLESNNNLNSDKNSTFTSQKNSSRKRTTSQRTNQNHNLNHNVKIKDDEINLNPTDLNFNDNQNNPPQPVRRSARNNPAFKKVLSFVDN